MPKRKNVKLKKDFKVITGESVTIQHRIMMKEF